MREFREEVLRVERVERVEREVQSFEIVQRV